MRNRIIGGIGLSAALVAASFAAVPATGAPQSAPPAEPTAVTRADNLPNHLADSQTALKKEAIARVINGTAKTESRGGSEVVRIGNRWAELKRKADKVDPVFAVLSEFSDTLHPVVGGLPGPQRNEIPQPNPVTDNSTYWEPDFNQAHFNKMYNGPGESLADFYYKQSGGKYSAETAVSDWVQLPYSESRYGSNDYAESSTYWPFVRDSANAWYNAQIASGKTAAEISTYLKQFDVYDRYDADQDGNFNEADGYIDHFQAVHAGEGEEAGGGAQGPDAIWSHRWYAYSNGAGQTGPPGALLGGTQIGTSGIWVGDYTVQPENGGLGVFAHEFGHDLGLPDLYDTAGGDNSSAFWTLMSGGSWMSRAGSANIGTSPVYMGPWEKMFLGWLDYEVVGNNKNKFVTLGSAATPEGPLPQAVVVPLPTQTIVTDWNNPFSGSYEWWGGSADDLSNTLTRDVDLTGATTAKLSAKIWYEIEADYDYLYGEVSTNGGTSWIGLGDGLDGSSNGAWTDISYDLTAYAGQNVKFRFRYQTDGGVHLAGPFLDDIALDKDGTVVVDDVEAGTGAWTANGFSRMTGSTSEQKEHFYIGEFRTYTGYDANFKTGPYQFIGTDLVEKFKYQDGLLVWYVNYAYGDNNTSQHTGFAQALPFDARPTPIVFSDGGLLGNRRQPFDATFGTQKTDAFTFHKANGATAVVPSSPGIRTFDDSDKLRYWNAGNPLGSIYTAGDGVKITVVFELTGLLPIMIVQVKN